MPRPWPDGFARIPDDDWTTAPLEALALNYDTVERHGWYANLDPTVDELVDWLKPGRILVDYSGGTGILMGRLFDALPDVPFGVIDVDSSPKFLRVALSKLGDEPRAAFRRIRYLKDEKRLEYVDEVLGPLADGGVDGLVSTNAIHLYYGLADTLASWARVVRPRGRVFIQSGNIGHDPDDPAEPGRWIIDETVHAVHRAAMAIVREDPTFADHRAVLDDAERMRRHDEVRDKFFLPVRPLSTYTDALTDAGFKIRAVERRAIPAVTTEWLEFLRVYHEGILGWVGGTERVEGTAATDDHVADRHRLMALAVDRVFDGKASFEAEWTYITATRRR